MSQVQVKMQEQAQRISLLERIIWETFYMAARYANGRMTFAPSIVSDARKTLAVLGIEFPPDRMLLLEYPAGGGHDVLDPVPAELARLQQENRTLRAALEQLTQSAGVAPLHLCDEYGCAEKVGEFAQRVLESTS